MSESEQIENESAVRHISWKRKLLYTAVLVILAFIACEGLVRIRAWLKYGTTSPVMGESMYVQDEESGLRVPRPGYARKAREISLSINSLGFRGKEISKQKPRGTIRIACLGASTTFCGEVSDDAQTWPAQLEWMIQDRYPGIQIEVINAGVPGFRVEQSQKNLLHRVIPLEPDLVIVYHANNDIVHDTAKLAKESGIIESTSTRGKSFVGWLSQYSLLVDLLQMNLRIHSGGYQKKLSSIPDTLPEHFLDEVSKSIMNLNRAASCWFCRRFK